MPIKLTTILEFGDTMYMKIDPYQMPHTLVGIVIIPGKALKLRLSFCGDICEVYDFEASMERNEEMLLDVPNTDDE